MKTIIPVAGPRATDTLEPRQVRKEAAIRDAVCVAGRPRLYSGIALTSPIRERVHNHTYLIEAILKTLTQSSQQPLQLPWAAHAAAINPLQQFITDSVKK